MKKILIIILCCIGLQSNASIPPQNTRYTLAKTVGWTAVSALSACVAYHISNTILSNSNQTLQAFFPYSIQKADLTRVAKIPVECFSAGIATTVASYYSYQSLKCAYYNYKNRAAHSK